MNTMKGVSRIGECSVLPARLDAQYAFRATLAEIAETDGPRSVTRAILANKGLTPKRAKANRNPRVKKRQSYDKAKKKVSSMKSVFKPQEAAAQRSSAGYHGEKSGIGSKTVKSRKLSG